METILKQYQEAGQEIHLYLRPVPPGEKSGSQFVYGRITGIKEGIVTLFDAQEKEVKQDRDTRLREESTNHILISDIYRIEVYKKYTYKHTNEITPAT